MAPSATPPPRFTHVMLSCPFPSSPIRFFQVCLRVLSKISHLLSISNSLATGKALTISHLAPCNGPLPGPLVSTLFPLFHPFSSLLLTLVSRRLPCLKNSASCPWPHFLARHSVSHRCGSPAFCSPNTYHGLGYPPASATCPCLATRASSLFAHILSPDHRHLPHPLSCQSRLSRDLLLSEVFPDPSMKNGFRCPFYSHCLRSSHLKCCCVASFTNTLSPSSLGALGTQGFFFFFLSSCWFV